MATFSTALRNARADAITSTIGASGKLKIYAGGAGGTLLATLAASATFAPAAASGVLTANSFTQDSSADASGTADAYTLTKSDDTVVVTGTVSESGGGGELILNDTAIVAGGTVSVTSLTITEAA